MLARHPTGPGAAALKYDLLTVLGLIGLGGSSTTTRSMLRLIALITARYNWRTGEMAVGRREIARLWNVDERTVKREMARLRGAGLVVQRRPGTRGRVAVYSVDFAAALAACDVTRVGPDFAARMLGEGMPAPQGEDAAEDGTDDGAEGRAGQGTATVIPFPSPAEQADPVPVAALSDWAQASRALRHLGPAAHKRWIEPLARAGCRDGRLMLEAPSRYHASYVERTYADAILRAVRSADASVRSVLIVGREGDG